MTMACDGTDEMSKLVTMTGKVCYSRTVAAEKMSCPNYPGGDIFITNTIPTNQGRRGFKRTRQTIGR